MPIYQYDCPTDGAFEERRAIDRRKFAKCPICGAIASKKMTIPHVHYRGSGFTSTDAWMQEPENPLDVDD